MFENPNISKVLKGLTVKIINQEVETGTGFILKPQGVSNQLIIVTAKHNLYENIQVDNNEIRHQITIIFFDNNEGELLRHNLNNNDVILKSPDKSDDIIAILINVENLLNLLDALPSVELITDNLGELSTTFFGFPKVDYNGNIHRVNSQLLGCSDTRLSLESNVNSEYSLTSDSLKGFSGSGIGLICNNNVYLLGIVTDFIDLNRFEGINISLLNKILLNNNLSELKTLVVETNPLLIKDNKTLNDLSDNIISNIETTIEGIYFDRKDLIKEASEKIKECNLLAITGDAGIGKSAFSKMLLDKLKVDGWKVISLRGEQVCTSSLLDTFKNIGVNNTIEDLLKSKDFLNDIIIYIDSAEKIIENNKFDSLVELIKLSNSNRKVKILISIRSYAFSQITTLGLINEHTRKYDFVTIPFLSDNEINEVVKQAPSIKNVLEIEKIKDIIRIPFYFKYIVGNIEDVKAIKDINETKLKSMLWEKIIKKYKPERELLFSEIAIKRLAEIRPNVSIDSIPNSTLNELLDDNVLNEFKNNIGVAFYSPTHDIFEDWALVRYISKCFELRDNNNHFFETISKGYAFIRGFRIWVHENIKNEDGIGLVKDFLFECLNSNNIQNNWKNEIVTAILKSSYSKVFFEERKDWLLANNSQNLLWFINTLRVTCRVFPNVKETNLLDDKCYFSTESLLPEGEGWNTIITFINDNYENLKSHVIVITDLLLDWQLVITNDLIDVSRQAFEIIHKILPDYIPTFNKRWRNNSNKIKLVGIIKLYLNLVGVAKDEITEILRKALQSNYKNNKKTKSVDYNTSEFYEFLIESSLWWMTSEQLCKYIPEVVIEIASTVWVSTRKSLDDYSHVNENELIFGLSDNHDFQYFPSSSKQTFVAHLLKYHPKLGIEFVVNFTNRSSDCYNKNHRTENDTIYDIKIPALNKEIIGNLKLWDAYRGGASTPYLLESILMALEEFLLESFELNFNVQGNEYCEYIVNNSNSVLTYSVVASVCTAYAFKVDKKLLKIILEPAKFILWDKTRYSSEFANRLAPVDPRNENPYLQEERYKSNNLKHRKTCLESLAFQLSFYEGYNELIYDIIDQHLLKLNNFNGFEKNVYGLALNRMDRRLYESKIVENDNNSVVVEFTPIIKEEYKDFAITKSEDIPSYNLRSAWSWGYEILDKNNQENNTYENWKKYYACTRESLENSDEENLLFNFCSGIALIGLMYFKENLSNDELTWCKSISVDTSMHFINSINNYSHLFNVSYSHLNEEPAIQSLPYLLAVEDIDRNTLTLNILKYILKTPLDNGLNIPRFEKFCKELWIKDSELAKVYFRYLIHLAQLKHDRWLNIESLVESFDSNNFINKEFKLEEFNIDYVNTFLHEKAFYLVSRTNNLDAELISFIDAYVNYIIDYINSDRDSNRSDRNYHSSISFKSCFSNLLLYQDSDKVISIFNNFILNFMVKEKLDKLNDDSLLLGFDTLKSCILIVDTTPPEDINIERLHNNFMFLWNILSIQTIKTGYLLFAGRLLLQIEWKDSAKTWKLLEKNKDFFFKQMYLFSRFRLDKVIAFVSTIGTNLFLFDSISVIADALRNDTELEWTNNYFSEKMIQLCFTLYESKIKLDVIKKADFLFILDKMVERNSAVAYLIRESFIS